MSSSPRRSRTSASGLHRPRGARRPTRELARLAAVPGAGRLDERDRDEGRRRLGRARPRPLARPPGRLVLADATGLDRSAPQLRQGRLLLLRPAPARSPNRPPRRRTRSFRRPRATATSTLEFTMGLSPGWADPYPWALPDQRLHLTGLDDGVYVSGRPRTRAGGSARRTRPTTPRGSICAWTSTRRRRASRSSAAALRRVDVERVLSRRQLPLGP